MEKFSNLHVGTIFYRNVKCILELFGILLHCLNLKKNCKENMKISNKKYFIFKSFAVFLFICFLNNLKEFKTAEYLNRRNIHNGEIEIHIRRLLCEVETLDDYNNTPVYEELSEDNDSDEEEYENDDAPIFDDYYTKFFWNINYLPGNIHKKKNCFPKLLTSLDRRIELEIMNLMKTKNESNYFMLKSEPKMRKIKRYFDRYKVLFPILIGLITAIIIVSKGSGVLALIPISLIIAYSFYLKKKYKKCKYISDSFAAYKIPENFV
ncbi:putative exported protein [Plasmodium reichenowi]|uniref:Putative exported protein n=1 Tax=Plasmodium reichenowi TaxID=5854 RepID=A0A151LBN6_PLARE|nr:putative exported protein [Plasmodium reichenowi]KYN96362.1 putative exported protein [Plasmodium reichenowi]